MVNSNNQARAAVGLLAITAGVFDTFCMDLAPGSWNLAFIPFAIFFLVLFLFWVFLAFKQSWQKSLVLAGLFPATLLFFTVTKAFTIFCLIAILELVSWLIFGVERKPGDGEVFVFLSGVLAGTAVSAVVVFVVCLLAFKQGRQKSLGLAILFSATLILFTVTKAAWPWAIDLAARW